MQLQQRVLGILGCSLHKINLYKFAVHKYQVHVSGSVIFPTIERLFVFSEFCWQKRRTVKCLVLFYCTAMNYGIFSCVFDNYIFLKQMWNNLVLYTSVCKCEWLTHSILLCVLRATDRGTDPRWVVASAPSTSKASTGALTTAPSTCKTSSKSTGKTSKTASTGRHTANQNDTHESELC